MKIAFITAIGFVTFGVAMSFGAHFLQAGGIQFVLSLSLVMLVED